jgi:hypothetical protein
MYCRFDHGKSEVRLGLDEVRDGLRNLKRLSIMAAVVQEQTLEMLNVNRENDLWTADYLYSKLYEARRECCDQSAGFSHRGAYGEERC